jgi:hypothetical protein
MPLTPTLKKKVRSSITLYCQAAVANEPHISYSQQRPFRYYDQIGRGYVVLDCSGFIGNCMWNASHDVGVYIHDPLDYRYTGYGWTGSLEAYLRAHGRRVVEANGFLVGDIARWGEGNHAHTAICSKAGSAATSWFTSHGREAGPNWCKLGYRNDLVGVWRHPALT